MYYLLQAKIVHNFQHLFINCSSVLRIWFYSAIMPVDVGEVEIAT